jgi:hypothetical protein
MLSDEDVAIRSQKRSIRPCTFQCCSPCAGPRCASGSQPADQHLPIATRHEKIILLVYRFAKQNFTAVQDGK